MKLSHLTRMAADTVDRTESGDDTAAGEFRAYLLANFRDVATCLGFDVTLPELRLTLAARFDARESATQVCFAESSHVGPMPQSFPTVDDGPSGGESWPVDCAAE